MESMNDMSMDAKEFEWVMEVFELMDFMDSMGFMGSDNLACDADPSYGLHSLQGSHRMYCHINHINKQASMNFACNTIDGIKNQ